MLLSLSLIFLAGLLLGGVFKKIKLPSLLGMLISGIILGPYCLNLIDSSVLSLSSQLRQISLIIILTRAGLSLNIHDLKQAGRPAILLCFLPALFEILAMTLVAPKLLHISLLDSAILGTVIAAVSPAVIVPKMIKLQEENYGTDKKIPQMILAGASVDDIFVIVLFSITTEMAQAMSTTMPMTASSGVASTTAVATTSVNVATASVASTSATVATSSLWTLLVIPSSIILGIGFGIIVGFIYKLLFTKLHIRDTAKVIVMLSLSFLLVTLESVIKPYFSFSSLLAVMTSGMVLLITKEKVAKRVAAKYSKLWVGAEILLFVLVGMTLDLSYVAKTGLVGVAVVFIVLTIRMIGVFCCTIKTPLTLKEKLFCMIAYIPKATVQAAIGALPLSMGLSCGTVVLTLAVLSIIITAPLGSFLMDITYKKLLKKSQYTSNQ